MSILGPGEGSLGFAMVAYSDTAMFAHCSRPKAEYFVHLYTATQCTPHRWLVTPLLDLMRLTTCPKGSKHTLHLPPHPEYVLLLTCFAQV
jgi:hypothetical protein